MLPAVHLKNKIEPDHSPVTFVNPSIYQVQLTKYIPVGSRQLYEMSRQAGYSHHRNKANYC